jgi:hypothetical protein
MSTGTMNILTGAGDTKIIWDSEKRDEVDAARNHFDDLLKKKYLAFRAEGREGSRGEQIKRFDPDLERIIMVPPSVGG